MSTFEFFRRKRAEAPERPEPTQESRIELLPMQEWVQLARDLLAAFDDRNRFTDSFGGFDTFAEAAQHAEVAQHVGDNRAQYEGLARKADQLRAELDQKVADKQALVAELRRLGDAEAADRIARVFSVKQ